MSAQTKQAVEEALAAHMIDMGLLLEGELISDYLIITACVATTESGSRHPAYTVSRPNHAMPHHSKGLAIWYITNFDKGQYIDDGP
jgi:hypothetical protein